MARLPLEIAGLMECDFIELGPPRPLHILLDGRTARPDHQPPGRYDLALRHPIQPPAKWEASQKRSAKRIATGLLQALRARIARRGITLSQL
jgi:hypothetical protein